jgi:hypothetical protein
VFPCKRCRNCDVTLPTEGPFCDGCGTDDETPEEPEEHRQPALAAGASEQQEETLRQAARDSRDRPDRTGQRPEDLPRWDPGQQKEEPNPDYTQQPDDRLRWDPGRQNWDINPDYSESGRRREVGHPGSRWDEPRGSIQELTADYNPEEGNWCRTSETTHFSVHCDGPYYTAMRRMPTDAAEAEGYMLRGSVLSNGSSIHRATNAVNEIIGGDGLEYYDHATLWRSTSVRRMNCYYENSTAIVMLRGSALLEAEGTEVKANEGDNFVTPRSSTYSRCSMTITIRPEDRGTTWLLLRRSSFLMTKQCETDRWSRTLCGFSRSA